MSALVLENARIALSDGDRSFTLRVDAARLETGEIVALTGASGAGKTLMLELVGLLRAPADGTLFRHAAQDLAALWAHGARSGALAEARGALFGFVPQTGGLMPFLTVAENIALPQKIVGLRDEARISGLIERLGLGDVRRLMPGALSIGQRQRTAIARALSHRAPFVIADEPTAALDPDSADTVLQLFLEAARQDGTGVLLSSHDLDRLSRFDLPRWTLQVTASGAEVESRLESAPC